MLIGLTPATAARLKQLLGASPPRLPPSRRRPSGDGGGGSSTRWTVRGKLNSALSAGGSAFLSVWESDGLAEFDTGEDIEVFDWLMTTGQSIASGSKITALWDENSGHYYVVGAQCI
jgi:hypothetical protein